ncbi:Diguanylate cyclase [Planctomycetales bacterium 10988]|nr:Diguanylate cyclase [Planctomycetales bacterium 10988]
MADSWQLSIYENLQLLFTTTFNHALELGRQTISEETFQWGQPTVPHENGSPASSRLVIANRGEKVISRKHLFLKPISRERFHLQNLSEKRPVQLGNGELLPPLQEAEVGLPLLMRLGNKTIRVEPVAAPSQINTLPDATLPPGAMEMEGLRFPHLRTEGEELRKLLRWLQTVIGVFQSASESSEFYEKAARAVVEIVGMDTGFVLRKTEKGWQQAGKATRLEDSEALEEEFNQTLLDQLAKDRKPVWEVPTFEETVDTYSEQPAVVAAPILDSNSDLVAVLYGLQQSDPVFGNHSRITDLEAMLMELIASAVAAGLARVDQEQAALAAKIRFEQFFTPQLAQELATQPDLLQGKDCEITLLFCDIRAFSRISRHLGPARTLDWIGDVMTRLSRCVLEHDGVLVDYIGDELMAMWGAPSAVSDHANMACEAALAMLNTVTDLNRDWEETLREPMDLGIGINTGTARVGNTGSSQKFKYGPLGNTVNLASRIQGATKYLGVRLLISEATFMHLAVSSPTRKLCCAKAVNIFEPVTLYELKGHPDYQWQTLKQSYEEALKAFESGQPRHTTRILGNLLASFPDDGPSLLLLSRAVEALTSNREDYPREWEIPGK